MIYMPVPQTLVKFIEKYQRFFLISHIDPDGDCLASSLALGKGLQRMGKQVSHFNSGPFGRQEIQAFEQHFAKQLPSNTLGGAVIILDCSHLDRLGGLAADIQALPTAVIDHHSNGGNYGDVRFINATAPSTSLLVQQLLEALGISLSKEEAELILFAFATDTGFFRHLGDNHQESFKLVAKLAAAGASPKKIYTQMAPNVSLKSRKYLGLLLQRAEAHFDGRFIFTWAIHDDIVTFDDEDQDSASIYQQLMSVEGVEIFLMLRERELGTTIGNIRTVDSIDAGELAASFGGGGHARAAGFSINKPIHSVFAQIKEGLTAIFDD